MSRSKKRTPICGHSLAESDKPFKQQEHQRERAAVRDTLRKCEDYDCLLLPHRREYGSDWNSPKDGKQYVHKKYDQQVKIMRK